MFVGPRTYENERGYHIVMPFKRASGGPDILVNRGFVSNDNIVGTGMEKRLRHPLKEDANERSIVVLYPRVYPPGRFGLPNEPEKNVWLQLNPGQMAHWLNEQAGVQDVIATENTPKESHFYGMLRRLTRPQRKRLLLPKRRFRESSHSP